MESEINKPFYSRTEKSSDRWETPQYFFDMLNKEFSFTLDACASAENTKCVRYYDRVKNGLEQDWFEETVFVNPPFSHMNQWVEKCFKEGQKPNTVVVMIIPARIDTKYWHRYVMKAVEIRFCVGRVNFLMNGKRTRNGSTFGLCIIVFRNDLLDSPFTNYPIVSSYHHKSEKNV